MNRHIAHPLGPLQFLAACFRHAGTGFLGVVGDASTVVGAATYCFRLIAPAQYAKVGTLLVANGFREDLLIELPLWIGLSILALRLLTAPYVLYREKPSPEASGELPEGPRVVASLVNAVTTRHWRGTLMLSNVSDLVAHDVQISPITNGPDVVVFEREDLVTHGRPVPAVARLTSAEECRDWNDFAFRGHTGAAWDAVANGGDLSQGQIDEIMRRSFAAPFRITCRDFRTNGSWVTTAEIRYERNANLPRDLHVHIVGFEYNAPVAQRVVSGPQLVP